MNTRFYLENCYKISQLITENYSTSFSLATWMLEKEKRKAIYAIYGFVRLADEIVDSFHEYDKETLIRQLEEDLDYALKNGISINPVLAAFADTVRRYNIDREYIQAFLKSMKNDLSQKVYSTSEEMNGYVYGSADVVGLMCLRVFCNGNNELFLQLKYPAQKLGTAFQKVNFLRDLRNDIQELGRTYFPELSVKNFDEATKAILVDSIQKDFEEARAGIKYLPGRSKLAVSLAFEYYQNLLLKIKNTPAYQILQQRIRIPNLKKYLIIIKVYLLYTFETIWENMHESVVKRQD